MSFEITVIIKMILASICGGLIGLEREFRGRPAGLKTFSLVCLGSALVMIINEYIFINLALGSGDSSRMAAQVISGIGFLGAGSIIVTGNNHVKGLTTAAALWVTAAVGVAIGAGFYLGGIGGLLVVYMFSFAYKKMEKRIMSRSRYLQFYIEGQNEEIMLTLLAYIKEKEFHIRSIERREDRKWYAKDEGALVEVDMMRRVKHSIIIDDLRQLKDVRFVEEM